MGRVLKLQLRGRAVKATDALRAVGMEYLSWVTASLVTIIKEVLSQA
jgi:hypothetical protein